MFALSVMNWAVDFYYQMCFVTIEICNETSDDTLTPKVKPAQSPNRPTRRRD